MSAKITQLSNGAEGVFIKNERFNTTLISFNFYVPLSRDTVADYALLPFIMTSCSKEYPDFSRLNFKLAKLCDDQDLFSRAFSVAKAIVADDPDLLKTDNQALRAAVFSYLTPIAASIS